MRSRLVLLFGILSAACSRGPNVSSDLPLKRVVVYRNGVGYFERSGNVDEERVTFEMRQRMIGDFLASLAIVERGGSSVRSASFPLELEDAQRPRPDGGPAPSPVSRRRRSPSPTPPEPEPQDSDMRTVVLHLDGEEHDLSIGYLAETPVWRPSYRVVIHEDGSADLQAWGIVQNLSGEDWTNVHLSLVAGAPLAFQSTLGNPVVPARPIVTDQGEIIAAVPQTVTSLDKSRAPDVDQVGPEHAPQEEPAAEESEEGYGYSFDEALQDSDGSKAAPARRMKAAAPAAAQAGGVSSPVSGSAASPPPPPRAPAPPPPSLSAPRSIADLASVALEAGSTRYDIPKPVTVPNESASMVLLTSQRVPGESVFLYSPDPGVPASSAHPFRVARFTNSTRGLLERGPIAVFERGSFLGQGLLESLPPRATATVPFALDRSIALSQDRRGDQQGGRLYRIEASQLLIERELVTRTVYKVDIGSNRPGKLLVRHPRLWGTRLHKPPPGTDDDAKTATAIIPLSFRPNSKLELTVEERQAFQQPVDWVSDLADVAVKDYLASPSSNAETVRALKDAWSIRDKLRTAIDERNKLQAEQDEIERASAETRHSLRAIEKNTQAGDLRAKLTKRLTDLTSRHEQVSKRLIELRLGVNELEVRFRDAVREIRVQAVTPPPVKALLGRARAARFEPERLARSASTKERLPSSARAFIGIGRRAESH